MRIYLTVLLAGVALIMGAEEDKESAIKKARKELEGTWQAVSYALDGKKAADEDMKKIQLMIDLDGKFKAQREGKRFIAGTTNIDPTSKPATFDIEFTEGDAKGQASRGIYKIEGETLTLCRAAAGKDRPTEFASKPESGHTLLVYRRETQAEAIDRERKQIAGTWRVVALIVDGTATTDEDSKKIAVINEADGKWAIEVDNNLIARGTSEIDPTKKPKTIDFVPSEGPDAGLSFLGIYELEEETRKLCYAQSGRERPTSFSSELGSGYTLVTFKREKP